MVWEALRTGIERADVGAPERIRTILRGAKQPEKCRSDSWARFTRFVKSATSQELLDLIVTFEWGIGSDGSEDLELKITAR